MQSMFYTGGILATHAESPSGQTITVEPFMLDTTAPLAASPNSGLNSAICESNAINATCTAAVCVTYTGLLCWMSEARESWIGWMEHTRR